MITKCPICKYPLTTKINSFCTGSQDHYFILYSNNESWEFTLFKLADHLVIGKIYNEFFIIFNYYDKNYKRIIIKDFKIDDVVAVGNKYYNSYKNLLSFS